PLRGGIGLDKAVTLAVNTLGRDRASFKLGRAGLVVEQVQMAWAARHEQMDHVFGARREVRRPRGMRVHVAARSCPNGPISSFRQQCCQRDLADSDTAFLEEVAPGYLRSELRGQR